MRNIAAIKRHQKQRQQGLTLIELLVALFIFALISGAGVYALRLATEGQAQLALADDQLREWQLARIIIKEDLAQLAPRVVRDDTGARQAGPFVGGLAFENRNPIAGETPLMGFVRRGWANPEDRQPRSTLQYVEYILKADELVRRVRPYLDDAPGQPRADRVLFTGLLRAEMTFLANETTTGLQWADVWPATTGGGGFAPRAVRLEVDKERLGVVEQLFWIGDYNV